MSSNSSAEDEGESAAVREFVNQGFLRWEQARAQWVSSSRSTAASPRLGGGEGGAGGADINNNSNNNNAGGDGSSSPSESTDSTPRAVCVPLEVDEIIDVIFSPRWRNPATAEEEGPPRRFPQNVPLPQMVDVLVDLWEAEGLDM